MSDTILAGRYRLLDLIGEGGMAHVYRAMDQNTGHNVAIKVLKRELSQDADYVIRFQREAEAASKMSHHNIVNLLDVGMDGVDRYLVMEYVQGNTLKQLIQEKEHLSAPVAAQICIRILSALQHAHERGIIHRDIKPQNILVAADGHVKVADFGIARIANSQTLTRDDSVMGTVYYYSPEQASGQKVGATSDIYSTGIVLYEMLTGRVPFTGDTQVAIAMQHLKSKPVPIEQLVSDVPPAVCAVCMRAMAKDPANRYQSAKDMASELQSALAGRLSELQPLVEESTGYTPPPRPIRKPKPQPKPQPPVRPKQKMTPRRMFWTGLSIFMAVLVCFGLTVGVQSIIENVVLRVTVPDLLDLDVGAAERTLGRMGLVSTNIYVNNASAAGTVIMVNPEPLSTVYKGETIFLTVSSGPATPTVPVLTQKQLTDAIAEAQGKGLTISVISYTEPEDGAEPGTIVDQIPTPGTACASGDIVQVTVVGVPVTVPSLTGMTPAEAREALDVLKLTISSGYNVKETNDPELHGKVADQSPKGGAQAIQGSTVYLTLYQVKGRMCKADLTLTLPERTETISYRVVLFQDQVEVNSQQGTAEATDSRHPTVQLSASYAGDYTYRVYCNGEFAYEGTVTLQ